MVLAVGQPDLTFLRLERGSSGSSSQLTGSFTSWVAATSMTSSSLILSNTTRWLTRGRPSQPVTPTPLRTTWLAVYLTTAERTLSIAQVVPISPPRLRAVVSSVMIRLLTASARLLVTGRLVTRAFCPVASLFSTTRSSFWVASTFLMASGPTRFGSLRLALRAGCRRVLSCQFRSATYQPPPLAVSSTQVAALISRAAL